MRRATSALLGLALSACVQPAFACRCVEPSLQYAYKHADAVGKIRINDVSVPSSDGSVTAQGEILKAWKANLPLHIQIVTGEDCAYPLKAHETYILYLSKGGASWGTYKCRGNRSLRRSGDTIRWLNKYGTPIKVSGKRYSRIIPVGGTL